MGFSEIYVSHCVCSGIKIDNESVSAIANGLSELSNLQYLSLSELVSITPALPICLFIHQYEPIYQSINLTFSLPFLFVAVLAPVSMSSFHLFTVNATDSQGAIDLIQALPNC